MCGHTRGPVIYSKFHRNPFRGFGTPGGQNLAFPITLASRFYNSLYFRTSRDINKYKRKNIQIYEPTNTQLKAAELYNIAGTLTCKNAK